MRRSRAAWALACLTWLRCLVWPSLALAGPGAGAALGGHELATAPSRPPASVPAAAGSLDSAASWLGLSLALLTTGTVVLVGLWRWCHLPATAGPRRRTTPPSELPPALAGILLAQGARPKPAHALGTVFDLARRGVLTIGEKPRGTRVEPREYLAALATLPAELRPHERAVLAALFGARARPDATSRVRQRMRWLTYYWYDFAEPLRAEIVACGW